MKQIAALATLCLAFCLLSLAVVAPAASQETTKVGFVDMQRALENSTAGQAATKRLKGMADKYTADIKTAKDKLEAMKEEIDKQSLLWNEKTRRDKEDEIRRLERDYQRLQKDSLDELKATEGELSSIIGRELMAIIQEIGKTEGFTLVLERKGSAILYAPSSIDLTDKVIKAYDSQKQ